MLEGLGLSSPKTFTVSMPEIIKNGEIGFKLDFIRGVFDTDGCIITRIDKKILNYPNLSLSSRSKSLIEDIHKVLQISNFNSRITIFQEKGKPRYMLRLFGFHELYKYMSLIGFCNPPKLEKATKTLRDGIIRGPVDQLADRLHGKSRIASSAARGYGFESRQVHEHRAL